MANGLTGLKISLLTFALRPFDQLVTGYLDELVMSLSKDRKLHNRLRISYKYLLIY